MSVSVVRVLVVDDQFLFRRAMAAVVEETEGFKVVERAGSGEESLDAAADLRPDLVLMDVNLPGIDGLAATRRLRAGEAPPVVLLLSTYDEPDGVRFVAESGAAGYVTKSAFDPTGSRRHGRPPAPQRAADGDGPARNVRATES